MPKAPPMEDFVPASRTVQAGSRGGSRVVQTIVGFDLSVTGNRVVVPIPRAVSVTVSAARTSGTWGTAQLEVKRQAVGGPIAFASAKAIPAGGGSATVSEDEALGLTSIVVVVTTAEGAAGRAALEVSVEEAT